MRTTHAIKDLAQMQAVMSVYPPDSKNRLLLECGVRTGLRISDILNVKVGDVLGKDTYQVIEQKTGKKKELAIHDRLKQSIAIYVKKEGCNQKIIYSIRRTTGKHTSSGHKPIASFPKRATWLG